MTCAPSEDQPGHLPSLIRAFAVRSMGSQGPNAFSCGQVILLVWSNCGSDNLLNFQTHVIETKSRDTCTGTAIICGLSPYTVYEIGLECRGTNIFGEETAWSEPATLVIQTKESGKTFLSYTFQPQHDKTIKVTVRPAKTQISLGIRPVWSESSLWA